MTRRRFDHIVLILAALTFAGALPRFDATSGGHGEGSVGASAILLGGLAQRLLFATVMALIVPMVVLLCRAVQDRIRLTDALRGEVAPARERGLAVAADWCALLGGLALAWNPFVLSMDRLNDNLFATPLMLLLLWLLVAHRKRWVWVGLAYGALMVFRIEAICFLPAVCWWYLKPSAAVGLMRRLGWLAGLVALAMVAMGPMLWMYGLPGWESLSSGLFNWPLHDRLVRTPHFAFPTFLLFPLVTARALGTIGVVLAVYGGFALHRHQRDLSILLLTWLVCTYLFFALQEGWDEARMTSLLLVWAPLAVWLPVGLLAAWGGDWAMVSGERSAKEGGWWEAMRIRLTTLVALSFLMHAGIFLAGKVEVPADQRWYAKYPSADQASNPTARAGLAEVERKTSAFFTSYETVAEITRERAKLVAGWPWPAVYLPLHWEFGGAAVYDASGPALQGEP